MSTPNDANGPDARSQIDHNQSDANQYTIRVYWSRPHCLSVVCTRTAFFFLLLSLSLYFALSHMHSLAGFNQLPVCQSLVDYDNSVRFVIQMWMRTRGMSLRFLVSINVRRHFYYCIIQDARSNDNNKKNHVKPFISGFSCMHCRQPSARTRRTSLHIRTRTMAYRLYSLCHWPFKPVERNETKIMTRILVQHCAIRISILNPQNPRRAHVNRLPRHSHTQHTPINLSRRALVKL